MSDGDDRLLSVVVTIVDGGAALDRCLTALSTQTGDVRLEVIVPYDATVSGMDDFASKYPRFRFVNIGSHDPRRPTRSLAGQHELFDVRRSHGLRIASGEIIAMLEDRGVPRADWAASVMEAHRAPHVAIGGGVECGRDALLNWAVYFCDFGRYQLPLREGPAEYITDVNLSYKRPALEQSRPHWENRYHETTLHWSLQRAGHDLWLSPSIVIDQIRDHLKFWSLIKERFYWARLFAYTRIMDVTPARRAALVALSPLLPFLLFARLAWQRIAKGRSIGPFAIAAPATMVLLISWSLGEVVGYVTGTE